MLAAEGWKHVDAGHQFSIRPGGKRSLRIALLVTGLTCNISQVRYTYVFIYWRNHALAHCNGTVAPAAIPHTPYVCVSTGWKEYSYHPRIVSITVP